MAPQGERGFARTGFDRLSLSEVELGLSWRFPPTVTPAQAGGQLAQQWFC